MDTTANCDFPTKNKEMIDIYKLIGRIASSDVPILIEGETGTGKEFIAQKIHETSYRKEKPFVIANISSIPSEMLEQWLFGHENKKTGKFIEANGGTILIDEIYNLTLSAQMTLLNVLNNKKIISDCSKVVDLDVRIIATTDRNIEKLTEKNLFRQDLLCKLSAITIKLPKLKERKEDINLLVSYFLEKYSYLKKGQYTFTDRALSKLKNYNWPGNIRELESVILYAIITAESNIIDIDNLPTRILGSEKKDISLDYELRKLALQYFDDFAMTSESFTPYNEYMKMVEAPLIETALIFCDGNISKAAKVLGINRNTLRKKIKIYGIK